MADRSFEQQVHEELAGLRIKPDEAVWTNIEAALQKEKKRRFFWIFFLLIGLSGASVLLAYINWNSKGNMNKPDHSLAGTPFINDSKNISKKKEDQQDNLKSISGIIQETVVKPDENKQSLNKLIPAETKKNESPKDDFIYASKKKTGNIFSEKITTKSNDYQKMRLVDTITQSSQPSSISESDPQEKKSSKEIENQNLKKDITDIYSQIIDSASSVNKPELAKKDSTVIETKINLSSKKKWQWGIHAAFGQSNTIDGFNIGKKNALVMNAITAPGGVTQTPFNSSVSLIKGSFSLQLGAEISKQIRKKNRLAISLDYQLYQTHIQTGSRIDSITFISSYAVYNNNRYYYSTGNANRYTSYYHILAAGAGLYLPRKLFHIVPVRWNLGLNMQLLIASNGLLYDASSGKLFQNNALLAKFQPQVFAGFDIGMGKSSPFYVGPSIQYTLSKLSSSGAADKHLFFAGARLSFLFPEKKKKMQR